MKEKRDLIRVVRSPEGVLSLDPTGKKPGRGAYLCRNLACMKRAVKQRQLERQLQTGMTPEVIQALESEMAQLETEGQPAHE